MALHRTPIATATLTALRACALLATAATLALPVAAQVPALREADAAARHPSSAFWRDLRGPLPARAGVQTTREPLRHRALTLDRSSLAGALQVAPREFTTAARQTPLVLALPDPAGGFQRFQVVETAIMEPGLAERHPHIKTYSGRGIDDPTASLRITLTQLGFEASVRSQRGAWFIDTPEPQQTEQVISYWRQDVAQRRAPFAEGLMAQAQLSLNRGRYRAADTVTLAGLGFEPNSTVTLTVREAGQPALRQSLLATVGEDGTVQAQFSADPYRGAGSYEITASDGKRSASTTYRVVADAEPLAASVGDQLRTYRLALVTDPAYATFHGAANVTAAKTALMNRVNQVYEDDLSVRMVLIANTDRLNLNTAAEATGANGPCGGSACFTTTQVASCSSAGLTRNRIVAGLLVGAENFDVGHLALGGNGGGIASLGVVGLNNKAQGCTGISPPTGDVFAIDFVAHELGHQFAGNHTFNGTLGNCSGANRSAANSVEPGSGTSVMAYAGICGNDNTQSNSDPYFSQRSFDEITTHVTANEQVINEVQQAAITNFTTNGQQFQLRWAGADSAPIVRGTNFTAAGVQAAIQGIAGWPAGATVTVASLTDTGFSITFGGALAGTNVANLQFVNCTVPCTGYVNDIARGGITSRQGGTVTATGNSAPVVTTAAGFTIPLRTPFALTGSATDADGDTVTYLWEQTDRGAASGTSLVTQSKADGPLFRQFSKRAVFDASIYNPPGQNMATTNPTRVFPDLEQVLANNTNAQTGSCANYTSGTPSAAAIDCLSESLPTAAYVGFAGINASPARLNFRLTARDGRGGVGSAETVLTLASAAGPFLLTAPTTAVTLDGATRTTVSWAVAGTDVAPVSTANVRITLSADGGATWPFVLAASTPNDGSQAVTLPNVATTQARVRVEAIGNVFFDVSKANFAIRLTGDVNGDGAVTCADVTAVRLALGTSTGQPGYNAAADVVADGTINVRDVAYVTQRLPAGTVCP
jgi:trimeric autotransporter adhesin